MKHRFMNCRVTSAMVKDSISHFLSKTTAGRYTSSYCPVCQKTQVVFRKGTTPCPDCGRVLYPCHGGECEECDFLGCKECPYGCPSNDDTRAKAATNRPVTAVESRVMEAYWRVQSRLYRLWLLLTEDRSTEFAYNSDIGWYILSDDTEIPF